MHRHVVATILLVLCIGCARRESREGTPSEITSSQPSSSVQAAPAPTPRPVPPKHSYTGRSPAATGEAASPDPETIWFNQLKSGMLKQHVPPMMQWKVASTVTVVVGGENADTSAALPNATASAAIKVARQMRVIVFSPDNPDEFTIQAEPGTQEAQFVPLGTTASPRATPGRTRRSPSEPG